MPAPLDHRLRDRSSLPNFETLSPKMSARLFQEHPTRRAERTTLGFRRGPPLERLLGFRDSLGRVDDLDVVVREMERVEL